MSVVYGLYVFDMIFFFSSRRRHTRCALVTGVQTCALPISQVASLADHHCRVLKMSDGKTTRTAVTALNEDERVEEIARMLGGVKKIGRASCRERVCPYV